MDVPRQARPRPRAHLDTVVLLAALGYDEDVDLVRKARQFLHRTSGPVACVSLPVLGEVSLKLLTVYDSDSEAVVYQAHEDINRFLLAGKLVTFGLGPPDTPALRLAAQMQKEDGRISPTDAVVIASMLADPDAAALYSTDEFVGSRVVQDLARECGKRVLGID